MAGSQQIDFTPSTTPINVSVTGPISPNPYTWTFTAINIDDDGVHPYDLSITNPARDTILAVGAVIAPGLTVAVAYNQDFDAPVVSITGTPTVNGDYPVYLTGKWVNDNIGPNQHSVFATMTIHVYGADPLATTPASGTTIVPTATVGVSYASNQFIISNGAGPYLVELSGGDGSVGLSTVNTGSGTASITTAGTGFYLVGTPSTANAGQALTIKVTDQTSGQVYAGATYNFIINNPSMGTMSVTEVSGSRIGYPTNTGTCVQRHPFTVTFDAGNSGHGAYTWSTTGDDISGSGLSISTVNNKGVLSGIPLVSTSYSINIRVQDSDGHFGSTPLTLNVNTGANFTGGPLPASSSINNVYGPTTLTAVGGKGGTNQWKIKWRSTSLVESPGLPWTNGTPLSPAGSPVGGWQVINSSSVIIGGTPTAPVPAGTKIIVAPGVDDGAGGWVYDTQTEFPVEITGNLTLTITPLTLPVWLQNVSNSVPVTSTGVWGGGGSWTVSGLPSGINETLSSQTTSAGVISGGTTTYGTFGVDVNSTDFTGAHGHNHWTLTVGPNIWTNDTLPAGTRNNTYSHDIVFAGGDSSGFVYSPDTTSLPNGFYIQENIGTGNNTLRIKSDGITAVGGGTTYYIKVRVTVNTSVTGGTYWKDMVLPIVINGGGSVQITPASDHLCVLDSFGFPGQPKVRITAVVTNGATNRFTITPPVGWTECTGAVSPYDSNSLTAWTQSPHSNGDHIFTLTSVDDGTTKNVTVSVSTGNSTDPTISPAGPLYLWSGENIVLTPQMLGACNPAGQGTGNWYFADASGGNGLKLNGTTGVRAGVVTLLAPTITTASTVVVGYHPSEDPDRGATILVNLVPGPKDPNFYIINSSPLPDGHVSSTYGPVTLTTNGATGQVTWATTFGFFPETAVLNPATGVISSPATLTSTWSGKMTVTARDSSSPPKYASKTFDLSVTTPGGATITSVTPTEGKSSGGDTITIKGTNFNVGDKITFASMSSIYQLDATSTTRIDAQTLTVVTPNWGSSTTELVGVILKDSGSVTRTTKPNFFTFRGTTPGFAVNSFSPTYATVGDSNKIIDVFGSGFDGSCSIKYTASWGGGEQTLSDQSSISDTNVRGTIASSNFSSSHAGTTAAIKVIKVSDGSSQVCATQFQVRATTLSITTASLPAGTRGNSYSQTVSASGGSLTYTNWQVVVGNLPTGLGLTISGNDGLISGTMDLGADAETFTIRVTDSLGATSDKQFTIAAEGGALVITTSSPLPDASINAAYSKTILASGGVAPLNFSISSGNLPLGLNISTGGVISGTPTTANSAPVTFSFTVRCIDSDGSPQTADKPFSLTLNPPISTVTISALDPAYGPVTGGTPVTITGTGFVNGASVLFGNVSATNVVYNSSISIIATAPPAAGAGFVAVAVQNPDTGVGTFSVGGGYEYRVLTSPVVDSIDRKDGPFAGGQTVVLSGSNFQGVSSIKFGLTVDNSVSATFAPEDIVLGTNPQTITLTTPPGVTFGDGSEAVQVSIFITNASGQTQFPAGIDGYTYRPPPIITAVIPNSGPTSGGQTVYVIGKNFFQRGAVKPRIFIGNIEVPASSITLVEQ